MNISTNTRLPHCLRDLYLSVPSIHAWQVDLSYEDDLRRSVGVVGAADYSQAVDTVLVDALLVMFSSNNRRKAEED